MQLQSPIRDKNLFFASVLALLLVSVSLILTTRNNLAHQQRQIKEHVLLAAKSISKGMEGNLRLSFMHNGARIIHPGSTQVISELIEDGDVISLQLYGPSHRLLLSSKNSFFTLDKEQFNHLQNNGQWHRFLTWQDRDVLIFAHKARPALSRTWSRHRMHRGNPRAELYLVLGIDITEHMELYYGARKAALWQLTYILGVVLFMLVFGIAFLKKVEQSRRALRLEEFHSQLLDNMPDGLLIINSHGMITAKNPAAQRLFNPKGENLVGMTWKELASQCSLPDLSPGTPDPGTHLSWIQCEVGKRNLEVLILPLHHEELDSGEKLILARDRTELQSMEDDLQEARRMATIGHMAAGLAHEIRNPLSALRGFAQYFANKLKDREPEARYAKTMVQESDRLNKVITDLLFMAKPRQLTKETMDIPSLIEDISGLLQFDLDHKSLEIDVDLKVRDVYADPDGLKQILLNLLLNSLDAVPEEGGIIRIGSSRSDKGTIITVCDNGPGIPAEIREQIFEPFYTTKSRGTGLGLAIVQKIMLDHQGRVGVYRADQLTCMELIFPKASSEEIHREE